MIRTGAAFLLASLIGGLWYVKLDWDNVPRIGILCWINLILATIGGTLVIAGLLL